MGGGWDEHPGGIPRVGSVPGHRAQDAGLLSAAGLPSEDSAPGVPTLRQAQEEPYTGVIDRILEDGLRRPGKQRHMANRIFERLRDEHGFDGGYTTVEDYVRERRRSREMSVPLSHPPGQAQCGFGEARVVIGGVWRKARCLVLDLREPPGRLWVCPARRPGGGTSDAKGA